MSVNGQDIKPGQKLVEDWEIGFTKMRAGSPIVASLHRWPNTTMYAARGEGTTVEEARLQLVTMLAKAIHEDPDPFGNLGNVLHASAVISFLRKLTQGEQGEGTDYQPASDWFLPDNLMKEQELPEGWEDVVRHVITLFQQYTDYYEEEDEEVVKDG